MLMGIIGAVGGLFAADKLHDYATRTLGQKAQVGDIAFVQMRQLSEVPVPGSAGSFLMNALRASVGPDQLDLVPLRVTRVGPITTKASGGNRELRGSVQLPIQGNTAGEELIFDSFAVKRLTRNGVDVQPGFNRIY
jgi:hypothetical protein